MRFGALGLRFCVLFLAALCASAPLSGAEPERVLYVYAWRDFLNPDVIRSFEEKENCRVEFAYYDSNETMYESISTGGGGYDIMTPASNMAELLFLEGKLLRLNHSSLPNIRNIETGDLALTLDPVMEYSVPYVSSIIGVGYRKDAVPVDSLGSWRIFDDQRLAGKMTLMPDTRETLGAALRMLGHSLNTIDPDEVEKAAAVVGRWKRNLDRFGVEDSVRGLREGKYDAVQAYNGDIAQTIDSDPNIGFFIPREGASMAFDHFVICSDSPSPDLAHAFINHFLDPEVACRNMERIMHHMPNAGALRMIDSRLKDNPAFNPPREFMRQCEVVRNLGTKNALYERAWEEVLFGE